MPDNEEPTAEEVDHDLAHEILGKFLGGDFDMVLDLFDQIPDPVVAGAVAVRVCQELDVTQIAEFLAVLEDESQDEDDCPDPGEGGVGDPKKRKK